MIILFCLRQSHSDSCKNPIITGRLDTRQFLTQEAEEKNQMYIIRGEYDLFYYVKHHKSFHWNLNKLF